MYLTETVLLLCLIRTIGFDLLCGCVKEFTDRGYVSYSRNLFQIITV